MRTRLVAAVCAAVFAVLLAPGPVVHLDHACANAGSAVQHHCGGGGKG